MVKRLTVFGMVFGVLAVFAPVTAQAAQNGFGDTMTADSYFPSVKVAAFGSDRPDDALIASTNGAQAKDAAVLNAIVPAAGDPDTAKSGSDQTSTRLFGPFLPGRPAGR